MKHTHSLWLAAMITFGVSTAMAQSSQEYVANASTLDLRAQPSWEAPSTGKLMRGEPIKVLEHSEVWAKVLYKNQTMYVPFALVSESSPWAAEGKDLSSPRISAHFRKKRSRSSKEIRETLKNVGKKKSSIEEEKELIDDPELIAQLSGGSALETEVVGMANPMDHADSTGNTTEPGAEVAADGTAGADLTSTPEAGSTDLASRDPAKEKAQPQAFGPAVKKVESISMKFDLKAIRRMDKYKLTDKDLRRFRAQGKLSTGD